MIKVYIVYDIVKHLIYGASFSNEKMIRYIKDASVNVVIIEFELDASDLKLWMVDEDSSSYKGVFSTEEKGREASNKHPGTGMYPIKVDE